MSTTVIKSETIGGILDKKLVLNGSNAAFVMDTDTSWTRLRVGMRAAFTDQGFGPTGTPDIWFGLLANPSPGLPLSPMGVQCTHFVGAANTVVTWGRGTVPVPNYTGLTMGLRTKVGNTLGGALAFGTMLASASPDTVRQVWIIEVTKGSPNFSCSLTYLNVATGLQDISLEQLETAMTTDPNASIKTYLNGLVGGNYYVTSSATAVAVDEAAHGYFNSAYVGWNRTLINLEVSEMLWVRMA